MHVFKKLLWLMLKMGGGRVELTEALGNSSDFLFIISWVVVLRKASSCEEGLGSHSKLRPWPAAELVEEELPFYLCLAPLENNNS